MVTQLNTYTTFWKICPLVILSYMWVEVCCVQYGLKCMLWWWRKHGLSLKNSVITITCQSSHHILNKVTSRLNSPQKVCIEFDCVMFCVTTFSGQTRCRASWGAGTQHQESGFLVQTHHTYCLHYRGGQELLHSLPKPVCLCTDPICAFHLCILFKFDHISFWHFNFTLFTLSRLHSFSQYL